MAKDTETKAGMAIDYRGNSVIDPTANVLQLVEAAVKRINDLRDAETKRVDDLRGAEIKRINEVIESQKEFNEKMLEQRDQRLLQKFESLAIAINKAETATELRFQSVNEFRNTLSDQQKTFLTTAEYKGAHQNLVDLVTSSTKTLSDIILAQKERIDKIENVKQGSSNVWIIIVGVIGFATGLISFILNILGK
jgi:hypothetical protein